MILGARRVGLTGVAKSLVHLGSNPSLFSRCRLRTGQEPRSKHEQGACLEHLCHCDRGSSKPVFPIKLCPDFPGRHYRSEEHASRDIRDPGRDRGRERTACRVSGYPHFPSLSNAPRNASKRVRISSRYPSNVSEVEGLENPIPGLSTETTLFTRASGYRRI